MGIRFRKTISLGKGARVNISKSGPSLSLGPRGASVSVGKRGRTSISEFRARVFP